MRLSSFIPGQKNLHNPLSSKYTPGGAIEYLGFTYVFLPKMTNQYKAHFKENGFELDNSANPGNEISESLKEGRKKCRVLMNVACLTTFVFSVALFKLNSTLNSPELIIQRAQNLSLTPKKTIIQITFSLLMTKLSLTINTIIILAISIIVSVEYCTRLDAGPRAGFTHAEDLAHRKIEKTIAEKLAEDNGGDVSFSALEQLPTAHKTYIEKYLKADYQKQGLVKQAQELRNT